MGRPLHVSDDDLTRLLASDDPAVRALAEEVKRKRDGWRARYKRPSAKEKRREFMREYRQRPEVKEKHRKRMREYNQRRKITDYARDIAAEKGISFEDAMREIGE